MTTLPEPTRETLFRAAEAVETRGWCRGFGRDAEGRVCPLVAIEAHAEVSDLSGDDNEIRGSALAALDHYTLANFGRHAVAYNDKVLTSTEEAAATLRALAAD